VLMYFITRISGVASSFDSGSKSAQGGRPTI
jgi:hypothetical protein